MNRFTKLISIVLCVAIVSSFMGCSKKNEKIDFLYETVTKLVNIDPQLATNDTELQVVYNTYEGLMKYDENNALVCGVAEKYSISDDGLTYKFTLKSNVTWSDGRPLTAQDFEFAFRRAISPETESPYAATLLAIKNASSILRGEKNPSTIGVTALNSKELKFELSYVFAEFLDLLTTPVAMPCNEKFFEDCKGYYGLNDKSILSNGYYKITDWNDDYCALEGNEYHENANKAFVGKAFIYFNSEDDLFKNIEKNEPHFTILDKSMIDRLTKANIKFTPTYIGDTVHSLIVNPKATIAEDNILAALMGTVKYTISSDFAKKYGAFTANSILPEIIEYSDSISCKKAAFDNKNEAAEKFIAGCEILEIERIFPTFTITYIKDDITKSIAQQIAAEWQNVFGVSVNITAVENEEQLISVIESGSYDAAIMPTKAISASPVSYLQNFASNSTTNYIGFKNKKFDSTLKKMNSKTGTELKKYTTEAVEIINSFEYIYPLYISSKCYYFKSDIKATVNNRNQKVYFFHIKP